MIFSETRATPAITAPEPSRLVAPPLARGIAVGLAIESGAVLTVFLLVKLVHSL